MPLVDEIRNTCSLPNASTPTTQPCRCSPEAKCRTGRLWTYVRDDTLRRAGGSGSHVLLLARSPR